MSGDAMLLVEALRDPATTRALDANGWTALIAMARAEQLIGTLAHRLQAEDVPPKVAEILDDARSNAEHQKRSALWEADCAARALAEYDGKIVLLKGTAYAAAGLRAGEGRHIGDLDILVARDDLPLVEALLLTKGGWEWVKEDAYDDAYYRDHMHELPPLIHKDRDRMIDVHHTILPLTARPRPDAAGLLGDAKPVKSINTVCPEPVEGSSFSLDAEKQRGASTGSAQTDRLLILSPQDMIIHCATHLIADGDLNGGLRNLWDLHCLVKEFGPTGPGSLHAADSWMWSLSIRADQHQLSHAVWRAQRLAAFLYESENDHNSGPPFLTDCLFIRRLTARDGWGRPTRKITRLIFYIRSHWLRMPPLMLARHLFTKWRKAKDK